MKKSQIVFTAVLSMLVVLCLAFTAVGCKSSKQVESIELNTDGCKLEFYVDDEFTAAGLEVIARYADGTTGKIDIKDCRITAPNMNVEGEKFVRVKYGELIAAYTVNVVQRPIEWAEDFSVDPSSDQKTYALGAVNAHLVGSGVNFGPSKEHPTWSVGGMDVGDRVAFRFDAKTAGVADIFLEYDHSAVGGRAVTSLFDVYIDDEPLETEATIAGGAEGHACNTWYCFTKTLLCRFDISAGHHTIVFKAKGGGSNFKGIVLDYKVLESIEINESELQKSFKVDEYFDQDQIVVKAHYLNDYTETLEAGDYKITKPDTGVVGTQTVTITFGDKTLEYDVEVSENTAALTGITVDPSEATTDYYLAKSLSRTGLIVKAQYDDGSEIRINHSAKDADGNYIGIIKCVETGKSTVGTEIGEKTVEFGYKGKTATYKINVSAACTVDPTDTETKYEFAARDTKLPSGPKVHKTHNDVYSIAKDKTITFYFASTSAGQTKLYMNYDHQVQGLIKNHVTVQVNGTTVNNEYKFGTPSFLHTHKVNGHCFAAPTFVGLIDLQQGVNKITFKFKEAGTGFMGLTFFGGEETIDPNVPREFIFEAENGILSRCTAEANTQFGASGAANVGSTVLDDPETEEFDGSLVTLRMYAAAATTVKFGIRVSSPSNTTLDTLVGLLKVNGKEFDLSVIDVPAGTPTGSQWFIWTVAVVEGVELREGLNIVEISPIANFDAIAVESTVELKEKLDTEIFYMVDAGTYAMYPEHAAIDPKNPEWITSFVQDDEVKFTVSVEKDVTTIFSFYMDHGPDNFGNGALDSQAFPYAADLYDFTVTHNGETSPFVSWLKFPYCPQKGDCTHKGYHNLEARLGLLNLKAGETTITVKFKKASISNLHGIGFYSTETVTPIVPDDRIIPDDPSRPIMRLYTFEAENGLRSNCNVEKNVSVASGGACVGNTDAEDDSVTFRIYALTDVVAPELTIRIANNDAGKLSSRISELTVNGVAIDVASVDIPAGSTGNQWHNYADAVITDIPLSAGLNEIVCKGISGNFDCIIIKSDVRLSETVDGLETVMLNGTAAQKPENVTAIADREGWVKGIAQNDVLAWTVNTDADVSTVLSIFIDSENCYGGTINNPWVNSNQLYEITVSHDGEVATFEISAGMIWWGGALGAGFNDAEIKLGVLDLKAGETTISVKFISDTVPNFHGIGLTTAGSITVGSAQA